MAVLVCDICGGSLSMDASGDFAVCESCGMKHTKDRVKAMAQEITGTVAVSNIAGIESLMKRGYLALEDSLWKEANDYFNKVLDIDAEYTPAYIGRLCAELKITREENLVKRSTLTIFPDYQKALRFAQGDYVTKIQGYDKFNQDLLQKNKHRFENIQKKIAKTAKGSHAVTLKPDGTVVATGTNIVTTQAKYFPNEFRNEYEMRTFNDGVYAGASTYRLEHSNTGGKGPCDTKDWHDIIAVVAGKRHTVGLQKDGNVVAVGLNLSVEYNSDEYTTYDRYISFRKYRNTARVIGEYKKYDNGPCSVGGWYDIIAIAAGSYHTVGLTKVGTVVACGRNEKKQCNTDEWRDIVAVTASDDYTIGLKADGTVIATGDFDSRLKQWKDLISISASENIYIGVKTDDTIVLIRDEVDVTGHEEQIMNKLEEEQKKREEEEHKEQERIVEQERIIVEQEHKKQERRAEQERINRERFEEHKRNWPKVQERIAKYKSPISAGGCSTVVVNVDGTVVAIGKNNYGQCNVSGWRDIVAVAAGDHSTVGLKANGTVVAIGDNEYGQCNVSDWGWHNIIAVAANSYHTVGLKADGTVIIAAGKNGLYDKCNVSGWRDIIAVAAGYLYTVGLKTDGTVVAVGKNSDGQCNVSGWRDIVAVATNYYHTVGLKADGTVVAVGLNREGQCNVSGWRDIVAVAANSSHTVGLKSDGTVVAVGSNYVGRCNVSDWRDIVAVAAGSSHTVGLKVDGTVVAVGDNEHGQCNVSKEYLWQQQGLCKYCGGKLSFFGHKCKSCGKAQE